MHGSRDRRRAKRDNKDAKIWYAWGAADDGEISTERLIALVADQCGVSTDRVVGAMSRHPDAVKVTDPGARKGGGE